jgi:hypothetical protein
MRGQREAAAAALPGDGVRRRRPGQGMARGGGGPVGTTRGGGGLARGWRETAAAARRRRRLDGGAGGYRRLRRRLGKCHGDALPTPPLHRRQGRRPAGAPAMALLGGDDEARHVQVFLPLCPHLFPSFV